jgi:hypothetical protein
LQLNTGSTPGDMSFNYYFLDSQDEHAHGATATVGIKAPGAADPMLIAFNDAANPYLTSYSANRITQSNPFAAAASSASGVGASFFSSDLDGSNQAVTAKGHLLKRAGKASSHSDMMMSLPVKVEIPHSQPQFFADRLVVSQAPKKEPVAPSENSSRQPVLTVTGNKSSASFDELFAHEEVGERHLPFRATGGNRFVASDFWITNDSDTDRDHAIREGVTPRSSLVRR